MYKKRKSFDRLDLYILLYIIMSYILNYYLIHWFRIHPSAGAVFYAILWLLSPIMMPFFGLMWLVVEIVIPVLNWLGIWLFF